MYRMRMFLALAWALALGGIGFAQDRGFASAIEWSPDGETIAITSSYRACGSSTPNSLNWATFKSSKASGTILRGRWSGMPAVIWLPIAYPTIMDLEPPIQIVDVNTLEVITEIEMPTLWTQVVWHPTDNLIAAGAWWGEAFVWDALTGEQVFYFEERRRSVRLAHAEQPLAVCWMTDRVIVVVTEWETYIIDIQLNETLQTFDIRSQGRSPDATAITESRGEHMKSSI